MGCGHARYEFLLPAALCNVIGYGVRTLRWQRILAPTKRASFGRLYPVLMTGFAATTSLPAHPASLRAPICSAAGNGSAAASRWRRSSSSASATG